jgi:hypothetical protein
MTTIVVVTRGVIHKKVIRSSRPQRPSLRGSEHYSTPEIAVRTGCQRQQVF